jgi:hypothetical protein
MSCEECEPELVSFDTSTGSRGSWPGRATEVRWLVWTIRGRIAGFATMNQRLKPTQ